MTWEPGSTITRVEVLHGLPWLSSPVTVVSDTGTQLAVLLAESPFTFYDHPFGTHPWAAHASWSGPQVLQVMREGDLYGVWQFYDEGEFRHTYINFESAIVRHESSYDTDDYGIDLIVHADGRREWKDVEDLHWQLSQGRINESVVIDVLAEAARVIADLDAGEPWWWHWRDWRPGAS